MSRKPFEALREVKYPEDAHDDGFNVAIEKANAAITQDHAEYKALRDTLCITERDLDRAINDRDTLREENERLKLQLAAACEVIIALGEAGQQFMEVIDFGAQSKEWLVLNAALFIRCRKAMEAFEKAKATAPTAAEAGQAGDTPKPPATKA